MLIVSPEDYVGKWLCVRPTNGWGWNRLDDLSLLVEYEPIQRAGDFSVFVQSFFCFGGELRGYHRACPRRRRDLRRLPRHCGHNDMLADAFDRGQKDPVGLPMGPGPIICERYKRTVARLKDECFDPPSFEMLLILAAGDSCCWTLDVDLNDGLKGIINALNEDGTY